MQPAEDRRLGCPPAPGRSRGSWGVLLALFLLVLAGYWSILDNSFLGDDLAIFYYVGKGLHNYSSIWTDAYMFYRPIVLSFFLLSYKVFGLNPVGAYVTNLILHCANSFICYLLFLEFYPSQRKLCLIAAMLFAIHPTGMSAVVWISSRYDLQYTFFGLLSIYYFKKEAFIASALLFTLSLLSKESAVAILFICAVIHYKHHRWQFRRYYPLVLMSICCLIYFGIRTAFLSGIGGYRNSAGSSLLFDGDLWKGSFAQLFYLTKNIVFPIDAIDVKDDPRYYLLYVQNIPVLYALVKFRRERPDPFWLMFAFVGLIPTLVIQKHGNVAGVGGRLAYFSMAGICMLISVYISRLNVYVISGYIAITVLILNINMSIWETASEHMRKNIQRIQHISANQAVYYLPDFYRGAALGVNVHPTIRDLYAPTLCLERLTDERECARVPAEVCPPIEPVAPTLKWQNLR